jgi:hypothetical protein
MQGTTSLLLETSCKTTRTTVATKNPLQGTTSLSPKASFKTTKKAVATKNLLQGMSRLPPKTSFKMTTMTVAPKNPWQGMTSLLQDELQGDKDDFNKFFLCPCGQQINKDDCHVSEDK